MHLFFGKARLEAMPAASSLVAGQTRKERQQEEMSYGANHWGIKLGLLDAQVLKQHYDQRLLSSNFADTYFYVVRLEKTPEIMCSFINPPIYDFYGNQIQFQVDQNDLVDDKWKNSEWFNLIPLPI